MVAWDALLLGARSMRELAEMLDSFEVAHNWLAIQPEPTCAEFAAVLAEVLKAPAVVIRAADGLLAAFDSAVPRPGALAVLADWTMVLEVERGRPQAETIAAIGERYLWHCLDGTAADPDAALLLRMLRRLADPMAEAFPNLTRFAEAVCDVAEETQRSMRRSLHAPALEMVRRAAPPLLDARRRAQSLAAVLATRQASLRRRALGLAVA